MGRGRDGYPRGPLPRQLRQMAQGIPIVGANQGKMPRIGADVTHRPGAVGLKFNVAMMPPVYPLSPEFARAIAGALLEHADLADQEQREVEAKADQHVDQVLDKVKASPPEFDDARWRQACESAPSHSAKDRMHLALDEAGPAPTLEQIERAATRQMPHSHDAERQVLGAILLHNELFDAEPLLEEADFYTEAHRHIFSAMSWLFTGNHPIDLVNLKRVLEDDCHLEAAGGPAYMASLVDGVPLSTNHAYYRRIVKEKATLRALVTKADQVLAAAKDRMHLVVLDEAAPAPSSEQIDAAVRPRSCARRLVEFVGRWVRSRRSRR